jgi:predicted transposase YdaD
MTNKYDRVLKENMKSIIPFVLKHILGVEAAKLEEIKDKLQVTLEREADFVQKVVLDNSGEEYLLHCELQGKLEKDMDTRMLLYYALFYKTYKLPVKQFVIFIGDTKKPKFITKIEHKNLSFEYTVVNLQDYDTELFLTSDKPEEVLLAILANFGTKKPEDVVQKILIRIQDIIGSGLKLQKYARQLQILSMLRKLQPQTNKIIQDMALIFDIREDIVYQQGISDAAEKAIVKMLSDSDLTVEQIANFQSVEIQDVLKIQTNLLREKRK